MPAAHGTAAERCAAVSLRPGEEDGCMTAGPGMSLARAFCVKPRVLSAAMGAQPSVELVCVGYRRSVSLACTEHMGL